ncbi:MAG: 23S rRNA (adenine(2503)-C(2))-methyltransferase RlmN [Spirochaetales bacterium]|nr:23S rRNA (adenine(2503)-C(2))-methyltransferase RlmN [Spirochaetales bacterium]
MSLEVLGFTYDDLVARFEIAYGKGDFHAGELFRRVYDTGSGDMTVSEAYRPNPALARQVTEDFSFSLPEISRWMEEAGVVKFTLRFDDGAVCDAVIIPMDHYNTLCVSSQSGCARGCAFCETAARGFTRNLSTAEIVSQVMTAVFHFQAPISNLVFMGMGEPMDNFDAVLRAVSILSDQRGLGIPKRKITISTCGHVEGIRRLSALAAEVNDRAFHTLRLAVSLNAPDDDTRSVLMPINRVWNMAALKEALVSFPLHHRKDCLFIEYVLIPEVNDGPGAVEKLAAYLKGLVCQVNLIPWNPGSSGRFRKPRREEIEAFFFNLTSRGIPCRLRDTRGERIGAACGMLDGLPAK